jgi:hypothetical protein
LLRSRFTYANVMATVALFVALGGGAYGAISSIPGSDGVIHGCYQKTKGTLRVVRAGRKCLRSERALAWSQRGPAGVQGPQGAQGLQGLQGLQGGQGAPGTAVAYAHVNVDGSVDAANSKNITSANVTKAASNSIYCFSNLVFVPHGLVASLDITSGSSAGVTAVQTFVNAGDLTGIGCPAGAHTAVFETDNTGVGSSTGKALFVIFE